MISLVRSVNSGTILISISAARTASGSCVALSSITGVGGGMDNISHYSPVVVNFTGSAVSIGRGRTAIVVVNMGSSTRFILRSNAGCNHFFASRRCDTTSPVTVVNARDTGVTFNCRSMAKRCLALSSSNDTVGIGIMNMTSVSSLMGDINNGDSLNRVFRANSGLAVTLFVPYAALARLANDSPIISSIFIVNRDATGGRTVNGTAMGCLGTTRNGCTGSVCATRSVTACIRLMSAVVSVLATFVTTMNTVSLVINNVNIVGVVLISMARQAQRVNVEGSLNTGAGAVALRFLARSIVLYLVNNVVNAILNVTNTFTTYTVVGVAPSIGVNMVTVTLLFSYNMNLFFNVCPTEGTTGVDPVRTLHERWVRVRSGRLLVRYTSGTNTFFIGVVLICGFILVYWGVVVVLQGGPAKNVLYRYWAGLWVGSRLGTGLGVTGSSTPTVWVRLVLPRVVATVGDTGVLSGEWAPMFLEVLVDL